MVRFPTVLFVFAVCVAAPLLAQGPVGTLNGTVKDPAGSIVPGATVVATNMATHVETTTTTTSTGTYTLPYLPAGPQTLRVTAPGFRTATAENVVLRVAQTQTSDISLEVGAVTEQVVVSDRPEVLDA